MPRRPPAPTPAPFPNIIHGDVNECFFAAVNNGESTPLGSASTSVTIQNLATATATIYIFRGTGAGHTLAQQAELSPNAAKTFTAAELGVGVGGVAPVNVLAYTQGAPFTPENGAPIACVAKQAVSGANLPMTRSTDTAVSGYNATSGSEVSAKSPLVLPIVQTNCGPGGCWDSIVRVANVAHDRNAAVEVRVFPSGDGSGSLATGFQVNLYLNPGEVKSFRMTDYVPEHWVGSAHIYTDTSVVAIVDRFKVGTDMWITNSASSTVAESQLQLPSGSATMPYVLYAPDVRLDFNGWNTGISIANTVDSDNTVNVQYFGNNGNAPQVQSARVAAHGMSYFYNPSSPAQDSCLQPGTQIVTCDFVGGAIILSEEPVAAAIDGVKYFGNDANVGQAFSYAATGNVFQVQSAPLIQKGSPSTGMGPTSGITFMNVNAAGTYVTTNWLNPSGTNASNAGASVVWVPAYSTGFVYSMTQQNLPNGFIGSALVTSDLPIAATTANVDYAVNGDGTAIWNLVNPCGLYRQLGNCRYQPPVEPLATKTFTIAPRGTNPWICVVNPTTGQDDKPISPTFDCLPQQVFDKNTDAPIQGEPERYGVLQASWFFSPHGTTPFSFTRFSGNPFTNVQADVYRNENKVAVTNIPSGHPITLYNWVTMSDGVMNPANTNMACRDFGSAPAGGYRINATALPAGGQLNGAQLALLGQIDHAVIVVEAVDGFYCAQLEQGGLRPETPNEMQVRLGTVVPPFQANSNGNASIDLPAGCYVFVVSAAGYVTHVSVQECLRSGETLNNPIDLTEDTTPPGADYGSLTKTFEDRDGEPIPNLSATLTGPGETTRFAGFSDANGQIKVTPLGYGQYELCWEDTSTENADDYAQGCENIFISGHLSLINLVLPALAYLDVCVRDAETKLPVEGATVQAFDGETLLGSTTSNAQGVASLTFEDPGTGLIKVTAPTFLDHEGVPVTVELGQNGGCLPGENGTIDDDSPGPIIDIDPARAYLDVCVRDADTKLPVSGATIKAYNGETLLDETTTGEDGTASFSFRNPGTYTLDVTAGRYHDSLGNAVTVNVGQNGGCGTDEESGAILDPTGDEEVIDLTPAKAFLDVCVRDAETKLPISGATVEAFSGVTALGSATSNASGVASLTFRDPGDYLLKVTAARYQDSLSNAVTVDVGQNGGCGTDEESGAILDPTGDEEVIDLTPAKAFLDVCVRDAETKLPISGATVEAFSGVTSLGSATSNASGVASLTFRDPGDYLLKVTAARYQDSLGNAVTVDVGQNGGCGTDEESGAILDPTDDEEVIDLTPAKAFLDVCVRDAETKLPISGATVEAFSGVTSLGSATSNASGVASLTFRDPGDYVLTVTAPRYQDSLSNAVTVEVGQNGGCGTDEESGAILDPTDDEEVIDLTPAKAFLDVCVRDAETKVAIGGATVIAFDGETQIASGTTNGQGIASLTFRDPGTYTLRVAATNYVASADQEVTLEVGENGGCLPNNDGTFDDESEGPIIDLNPVRMLLEVCVVDAETKLVIPGATVIATQGSIEAARGTTSTEGIVSLSLRAPGTYTLTASALTYVTSAGRTVDVTATDVSDCIPGENNTIDEASTGELIELQPARAFLDVCVRNSETGDGVNGAVVTAFVDKDPLDEDPVARATTNPGGIARLNFRNPGNYILMVTATGYYEIDPIPVSVVVGNNGDCVTIEGVIDPDSDDVIDVDPIFGWLDVEVFANGEPVANRNVNVYAAGDCGGVVLAHDFTDANGHVVFELLEGDYCVGAIWDNGTVETTKDNFHLTWDNLAGNEDVVIDGLARLRVKVLWDDLNAVSETVYLYNNATCTGDPVDTQPTNADGIAEFRVLPGTFCVSADPAGTGSIERGPIVITATEDHTDIDATIEARSVVRVLVTWDGVPLEGIKVEIFQTGCTVVPPLFGGDVATKNTGPSGGVSFNTGPGEFCAKAYVNQDEQFLTGEGQVLPQDGLAMTGPIAQNRYHIIINATSYLDVKITWGGEDVGAGVPVSVQATDPLGACVGEVTTVTTGDDSVIHLPTGPGSFCVSSDPNGFGGPTTIIVSVAVEEPFGTLNGTLNELPILTTKVTWSELPVDEEPVSVYFYSGGPGPFDPALCGALAAPPALTTADGLVSFELEPGDYCVAADPNDDFVPTWGNATGPRDVPSRITLAAQDPHTNINAYVNETSFIDVLVSWDGVPHMGVDVYIYGDTTGACTGERTLLGTSDLNGKVSTPRLRGEYCIEADPNGNGVLTRSTAIVTEQDPVGDTDGTINETSIMKIGVTLDNVLQPNQTIWFLQSDTCEGVTSGAVFGTTGGDGYFATELAAGTYCVWADPNTDDPPTYELVTLGPKSAGILPNAIINEFSSVASLFNLTVTTYWSDILEPGVQVNVRKADTAAECTPANIGNLPVVQTHITDSSAQTVFTLVGGTYCIGADINGDTIRVAEFVNLTTDASIDLNEESVLDVWTYLDGTVLGGVAVSVYPPNQCGVGLPIASGTTNSLGRFSVELEDGTYCIVVADMNQDGAPAYSQNFTLGTKDPFNDEDLRVEELSYLNVRVQMSNQDMPAGIWVHVYPAGACGVGTPLMSAQTGSNSIASFNITSRSYCVGSDPNQNGVYTYVDNVAMTRPDPNNDIDATINETPVLDVLVTLGGQPMPGVTVFVRPANNCTATPITSAVTGPDGMVHIVHPQILGGVSYCVSANPNNDTVVTSVISETITWNDLATDIDATINENPVLDVTVTWDGPAVSGVPVYVWAGTVCEDTTVMPGSGVTVGTTDALGEVDFILPTGNYCLRADPDSSGLPMTKSFYLAYNNPAGNVDVRFDQLAALDALVKVSNAPRANILVTAHIMTPQDNNYMCYGTKVAEARSGTPEKEGHFGRAVLRVSGRDTYCVMGDPNGDGIMTTDKGVNVKFRDPVGDHDSNILESSAKP